MTLTIFLGEAAAMLAKKVSNWLAFEFLEFAIARFYLILKSISGTVDTTMSPRENTPCK